jgi:cephalosporin-C deacetylase-like acetyl esterase
MSQSRTIAGVIVMLLFGVAHSAGDDLTARLRDLNATVIPADSEQGKQLPRMLSRQVQARLREANQRESRLWQHIRTRAEWEQYRDPRIKALRTSLGTFPDPPRDLHVRLTRTLDGDGYRVENLVFESRPGLLVTANLYLPRQTAASMPGILICHSHHNPKTQGELQDMGMTWARLGCAVLVMDQLGHGERRQHPFVDATSYSGSFRPGRQDYFFRYNVALQLHTIGDSLIGWMVWDLHRGVDLLLARGADKERIILLGAVAGGGDPAAVAAALDARITAVAPFNFGGPQPETTYPLPADAEESFNYVGGGSWESTRNLRLSARDGFLPWVIVGSVAPRGLIHAHEFSWDRDRDPVWKRYQRIYGFYDAADRLAAAQGRGLLTGQPPEASHCNNIGPEHRQGIYPTLNRWFGIAAPARETSQRRPAEELTCRTPDITVKPVHQLAADLGSERAAAARRRLESLPPDSRRDQLRRDWSRLLGRVEPAGEPPAITRQAERLGGITVERIALEFEPRIVVPLVLLIPERPAGTRLPVVIAFAQHGKQAFLKERSAPIAELLRGGLAVCLPDLRGTGETRPAGDSRGRQSAATSLSASELMLGQTLLGERLRDLRSVMQYLATRAELDPGRVGLWGDSFAPVNAPNRNLAVPLDADRLPDQSEPLGTTLALLAALFEDNVQAVYARGGLTGFASLLDSPFLYVPHDAVVPGALTIGDLCDVAAALAPRPLRLAGLVDGGNRRVSAERLNKDLAPTRAGYESAKAIDRLVIDASRDPAEAARWLLSQLPRN